MHRRHTNFPRVGNFGRSTTQLPNHRPIIKNQTFWPTHFTCLCLFLTMRCLQNHERYRNPDYHPYNLSSGYHLTSISETYLFIWFLHRKIHLEIRAYMRTGHNNFDRVSQQLCHNNFDRVSSGGDVSSHNTDLS